MRNAVIVAAVRSPLCKVNGSLAGASAMDLAAAVIREAVKRAKIDPTQIDEVIYSNLSNPEFKTSGRVFGLAAGLPVSVPGFQVERACASSLTGLNIAANMIMAGTGDCFVCGGVESCSNAPYIVTRNRKNAYIHPGFAKRIMSPPKEYGNYDNGITAEIVAERFHVTREECDKLSLRSHQLATIAENEHRFDAHIVPIAIAGKQGTKTIVNQDNIYRPDCSMESLAKLLPAFKTDGIVTAGNSSPITDGASAMVVMDETLAKSLGCEILARFKAFASVGLEPAIMGMGPLYATQKLLQQTGLTLNDIDLVEINEAFASQYAACVRELDLPLEKVNVNGGAIALGHPFTASGGILTARMIYELRRRGLHHGLIAFCIGGGLGNALLIECD